MNLLDLLCVSAAGYLALSLADRLRLINWRTTKPIYVAMYLCHTLWVLGVIWSAAFDDGAHWQQVFGLAGMFCWLQVTRKYWLVGAPSEVTRPGVLTHPEFRRYP
jgi:hypothetical protein